MELLACFMLEDSKLHYSFNDWPLHITIVPWFYISIINLPIFVKEMDTSITTTKPLLLVTDGIDYLGTDKVKCIKLKANPLINKLHQNVLKAIDKAQGVVLSSKFIGKNYLPHITTDQENLFSNEPIKFYQLYFVTKCNDQTRQVIQKVNLGAA